MKYVLIFIFILSSLYAQSNNSILNILDKTNLILSVEESANISQILQSEFTKKDYEIFETPDLERMNSSSFFVLHMKDGKDIVFNLESMKTDKSGCGFYYFTDSKHNIAHLAAFKDEKYGFLQINGKVYNLKSISSRYCILTMFDSELANNNLKHSYIEYSKTNSISTNAKSMSVNSLGRTALTDDALQIDVFIAYTASARVAAGGRDAIETVARLAVESTNLSFQNSGLSNYRINPVLIQEIQFTESGNCSQDANNFSLNTEAQRLRAAVGADICVLLLGSGNCGGSGIRMPATKESAYVVVRQDVAVSDLIFAHEIGHLFGCYHQTSICSDHKGNCTPYSNHGYYNPGVAMTIMSLQQDGMPYTPRVNYWSQGPEGLNGDENSNNKQVLIAYWNTIANFNSPPFMKLMELSVILASDPSDPWDPYMQGAAAIKVMSNYIQPCTLKVADIYNLGKNSTVPSTGPLTPEQMKKALDHSIPGWNWGIHSNASKTYVKDMIIKWVTYDFSYFNETKPKQYVPALVYKGGTAEWAIINGFSLAQNPWPGGNYISNIAVYGLYVTQLGEAMGNGTSFVTLDGFMANYMSLQNGMYHAIADPPAFNPIEFVPAPPLVVDIKSIDNIKRDLASKVLPLIDKNKYGKFFEDKMDLHQKIVYDMEKESNYTIVSIQRNNKTEVGILIDNNSSAVLEINFPDKPQDYRLISHDDVVKMLVKANFLSKQESTSVSYRYVFSNDLCTNRFHPLLEISTKDRVYYVSQDKKILKQLIKKDNQTSLSDNDGGIIFQNYPNPFNPVTQIKFTLSDASHVKLEVFDMLGRRISLLLDETRQKGTHSVSFNGSDLPSGFYIYKVTTGSKSEAKKMLLVK